MTILDVSLVPLVHDIAQDIRPGNPVGRTDEIRMRDGAERLADIRAVRDVPMRREEEGADAICVRGVSVWGFCGVVLVLVLAGGVFGGGIYIVVLTVVDIVVIIDLVGEFLKFWTETSSGLLLLLLVRIIFFWLSLSPEHG